jgi:hypothetical protein
MHELSDKYFLQIEPNQFGPPTEPINDELTEKVKFIYEHTSIPSGGEHYKGMHSFRIDHVYDGMHGFKLQNGFDGVHETETWVVSDNCDHFLPDGTITNSLCVYYVQRFRPYIPQSELDKIEKFYKMCKENPTKRWKRGVQFSTYKPTKEHVRILPTKEEEEAERKKWDAVHAAREAERQREAEEAEAADPRSSYFKEAMKRAGQYRPMKG